MQSENKLFDDFVKMVNGVAGTMAGSVSWHVQGGTGRFESATGLITSIFTLTDSGDLSEYQCGLIFVAD